MRELTFPNKERFMQLREQARDAIDEMGKISKSLGESEYYYVYAKSAIDTAMEHMVVMLMQNGIAVEEPLPFEPEGIEDAEE